MTLVSLQGNWIKVNKAFCQLSGYSEAELLEMTFQEMTPEEDLEADRIYIDRFVKGEVDIVRLHKRYIHKGRPSDLGER